MGISREDHGDIIDIYIYISIGSYPPHQTWLENLVRWCSQPRLMTRVAQGRSGSNRSGRPIWKIHNRHAVNDVPLLRRISDVSIIGDHVYFSFLSHGVPPPVIIHFRFGFSMINHPATGVPPWLWNLPYPRNDFWDLSPGAGLPLWWSLRVRACPIWVRSPQQNPVMSGYVRFATDYGFCGFAIFPVVCLCRDETHARSLSSRLGRRWQLLATHAKSPPSGGLVDLHLQEISLSQMDQKRDATTATWFL